MSNPKRTLRSIFADHYRKDQEAFRQGLAFLLKQRGWGSETSLATEIGLSQSYVNRIKHGLKDPSLLAMHAIADALGMTYESMIHLGRRLIEEGQNIDMKEVIDEQDESQRPRELGPPIPSDVYFKLKEIFRYGDKEVRDQLISHIDLCYRFGVRSVAE
ncbi:helix-turn-helix domain-containing protein [Thermodesulfobacteriota bacterium]